MICRKPAAIIRVCAGSTMSVKRPFVSVVIAVQNEEKFIGQTLDQIVDQTYPADCYEVIVIDGFSTDRTVAIVESYRGKIQNLKIMQNPIRLAGSSRNIGFKDARGEYMIIIDGHVYIENNNLLSDMVYIFEQTGCKVLSRPQPLTPPDNDFFQNAVAFARESIVGHGTDSTIYDMEFEGEVDAASSGAMYHKSIFEQVGYIDENFDAAEDYEFNYRVSKNNFKSWISPKLAVFYYPRDSLGGLFRQMARYGLGRFRFVGKYPAETISGNLVPPLFFIALLLSIIISLFYAPFKIALVLMLGVYFVALLAGSLITAGRRGMQYFPLLPVILFTIHLGLAYGFMSGFVVKSPKTIKKQC